jgi:hypothetical protein
MASVETVTCDFCGDAVDVPPSGGLPAGWSYYDLDRVHYDAFRTSTRHSWDFEVCRDCHERRPGTSKDVVIRFLRKIGVIRK